VTINSGGVTSPPTTNSTVTAPAGNSAQFPNAKVTFAGTGDPGAKIQVLRNNGKLGGTTSTDATTGAWWAGRRGDFNWGKQGTIRVVQTPKTGGNGEAVRRDDPGGQHDRSGARGELAAVAERQARGHRRGRPRCEGQARPGKRQDRRSG
jgi:hypothetical protein